MPKLLFDCYGKTSARVLQVLRESGGHSVAELAVNVLLEGDLSDSYVKGANANVLPTDTIKNSVYVLARQHSITCIEEFALRLAAHFLGRLPQVEKARIDIRETLWDRIEHHPDAFIQNSRERRSASLTATRSREEITSGIQNLQILKTGKSAFAGFAKDEYTTLPETADRLLGTVLEAEWTYAPEKLDFCALREEIRSTLLNVFAGHDSLSVQHTLYAMGEAVIAASPKVEQIHLRMPNKHCLLFDLSRFGLDNPNRIFVPIDEPSGYIEAVIGR